MSLLVFGLTTYFAQPLARQNYDSFSTPEARSENNESTHKSKQDSQQASSISALLFVTLYAIVLAVAVFSNPDLGVFKSWSEISPIGIVQLGSSIMLTFFLPGYAILLIMTKTYKLNPLLKVVLGYLFSMLITGMIAYILAAVFDASASQIKISLIAVYFSILIVTFISRYSAIRKMRVGSDFVSFNIFRLRQSIAGKQKGKVTGEIISILIIFGSLFALLIVSTYGLYGGITVGDQWFHQGRAIMLMSGSFRQIAQAGLDSLLPPFQSAIVAAVAIISGLPLVNSYATIAFLSIMPLFSFYYFFQTWVPPNMQRSKMLAAALFTICSGFGWIYLINLVSTTNPVVSELSSIETINSIRSYVLMPSNFIIASHPDFSTALIYHTTARFYFDRQLPHDI